jgi:hypothetical protein
MAGAKGEWALAPGGDPVVCARALSSKQKTPAGNGSAYSWLNGRLILPEPNIETISAANAPFI